MSRRAIAAPPDAESLGSAPTHVIVRDWPETLVPLRRAGVDLSERGGEALGRLPDADALVRLCLEATAWRGSGG